MSEMTRDMFHQNIISMSEMTVISDIDIMF
jgi:hypothetical protein